MEEKIEVKEEIKGKTNFVKQGRLNRAAGARFELKVRVELEEQGWILSKWMNNVDLEKNKLVPAKRKYNPFLRALSVGTGFPDFVAFKRLNETNFEVIGVEVKTRGLLDKEEKEKCKWLLDNKIFSKILIAKMVKEGIRVKIEYINFAEKYNKP